MGFVDRITGKDAQNNATAAAERAQFSPFSFFGPGGQSAGFGNAPQPIAQPVPGANTFGFDPSSLPPELAGLAGMFGFSNPGAPTSTAPAPGANGVTLDTPPGQAISTDLGDLNPLRDAFRDFAGQNLARPEISQGLTVAGADALQGLSGGPAPDAVLQAFDLAGLRGNVAGAANSALGIANQDPSQIAGQQLDILRQQAQPGEQRAVNSTLDRLFSQGRLGTTGGANIVGRLAESQNQADLGRQITAFDFARGIQGDATNRAGALGGLSEQLAQGGFGRTLGAFDFAGKRAQDRFGVAQQLFDNQNTSRQLNLNQALQSLGGVQGLDGQSLQNFQAALNAAIARSNASVGAASNLTNLAGQGNPLLDAAVGLGSAALGASDVRLKTNLQKLADGEFPIYMWDWTDEAHELGVGDHPTVGVLAQDVQKIRPEAVVEHEAGYLMVNYGLL